MTLDLDKEAGALADAGSDELTLVYHRGFHSMPWTITVPGLGSWAGQTALDAIEFAHGEIAKPDFVPIAGVPEISLPLQVVLGWFMSSDHDPDEPGPLGEDEQRVERLLDSRCRALGYDGWIDAFHRLPRVQ